MIFFYHNHNNNPVFLFYWMTEVRLDSGCIKPETPEHGEMFVLWSGLLVQFRCQSTEFKLVGPAAVICRNRTWTQDPPVCLHHHQQAPQPSDGESNAFRPINMLASKAVGHPHFKMETIDWKTTTVKLSLFDTLFRDDHFLVCCRAICDTV